jgi:hypothetical protein
MWTDTLSTKNARTQSQRESSSNGLDWKGPNRLGSVLLILVAASAPLLAASCGSASSGGDGESGESTNSRPWVGGKADVYGSDDRVETYQTEPESQRRRLARASAVLTEASKLEPVDDASNEQYRFSESVQTLEESRRICEEERFTQQPTIGFCSATLVASDLVATSGHCLGLTAASADEARCDDVRIVFNYAYSSPPEDPMGDLQPLPGENVYSCKEVEAFGWAGLDRSPSNEDWALVRLDREVTDRQPVSVLGDIPASERRIVQIGHPSGLPQKLAPGIITRRSDYSDYSKFVGNTFTYRSDLLGGNSGGGVFDAETGTLAGIPTLYSGENYVRAPDRECNIPGVCGENTECPDPPGAYSTKKMVDILSSEQPELLDELKVAGLPDDATYTFDDVTSDGDTGTTTLDGGADRRDAGTSFEDTHDWDTSSGDATRTRDAGVGGGDEPG